MIRPSDVQAGMTAVASGVILWLAASVLTDRREPWDSSLYWVVVYPLGLLLSALLGYRHPHQPWRWVLLLFQTQGVCMALKAGDPGNLWLPAAILLAFLALPGMLLAKIVGRRLSRKDI
ncbi:MAG: hypothetical protein JNL33_08630 [Betaproteobacteria bacterium]|nr:hypothetical protein [Betaproteobacteria bacterium]MBL8533907.1 hypothetical protein [Betaproteobacteria bacterium]